MKTSATHDLAWAQLAGLFSRLASAEHEHDDGARDYVSDTVVADIARITLRNQGLLGLDVADYCNVLARLAVSSRGHLLRRELAYAQVRAFVETLVRLSAGSSTAR